MQVGRDEGYRDRQCWTVHKSIHGTCRPSLAGPLLFPAAECDAVIGDILLMGSNTGRCAPEIGISGLLGNVGDLVTELEDMI
jgi:hypothetical protein